MRPRLKWPIRLVLTLGILYVGICFYMRWAQESFLFHPTVVPENHTWNLPSNAKELWLATEDGARLNAVLHQVDSAKGAVLFLHGNGGNLENSTPYAEVFARHGYATMVLDYRGYGKSQGQMSEQGLFFDVEAAYEYLKDQYPQDSIVVYGQSLGSGFATHLAAKYQPRHLVLETPYTSIVEVAQGDFWWLPVSYLIKYPLRSRDRITNVQCPVTVFHGTADETIPYEMGQEMSRLALKGELITCPGVGHNGCFDVPAVQNRLGAILH
jgi:pimeloyl-ACP methyl ester carboxylesterase